MSDKETTQARNLRRRKQKLRKLGYSALEAAEIVSVRSKLAKRGVNLDQKLRQMCVTGKIVYPSARVAKTIARDLSMSKERFNHNLHPYECPYCKLWHLTSSNRKFKKRIRS